MIENYQNDGVRQLLANLTGPDDVGWVWMVVDEMRRRYPDADHWTTGGPGFNYVDLRIGRRSSPSGHCRGSTPYSSVWRACSASARSG